MTIIEFITARLDEDEAAAQVEQIPIPPDRNPDGSWMTVPGAPKPGDAKVLADIAAKRRIIELARKDLADADVETDDSIRRAFNRGAAHHAHNVLLFLASMYADHPDYREEWMP